MGSQRAGHNLSEHAHTCVSHEDFHAVEPADALVDMTQCHEREGGAVRGQKWKIMHSKVRHGTEMLGPGGQLRQRSKD